MCPTLGQSHLWLGPILAEGAGRVVLQILTGTVPIWYTVRFQVKYETTSERKDSKRTMKPWNPWWEPTFMVSSWLGHTTTSIQKAILTMPAFSQMYTEHTSEPSSGPISPATSPSRRHVWSLWPAPKLHFYSGYSFFLGNYHCYNSSGRLVTGRLVLKRNSAS